MRSGQVSRERAASPSRRCLCERPRHSHYGDATIVLTSYLNENSRMMIHRRVRERLETLAPYLQWDQDPYLVVTPEGREGLDARWLHHVGCVSVFA